MAEASVASSSYSSTCLYSPANKRLQRNTTNIVTRSLNNLPKSLRKCNLSVKKNVCVDRRKNRAISDRKEYLLCQDHPPINGLSFPSNAASSPKTKKIIRVAVDVDEVLCSFLDSLNVFIAENYEAEYDISQYHVYDFMKIWKCSQAEANNRVHEFFKSKHFNVGIKPIPGAYQALCRLSFFCDLVVVTSRQHIIRQPSLDWISRHFTGLFSEVHFGNHFALEGPAIPKSEICKSLNARFLIDDNPRYAVECAKEGIEVLLFDFDYSYPWSKTEDGPSHRLITRVHNWQAVEARLMACIYSSL